MMVNLELLLISSARLAALTWRQESLLSYQITSRLVHGSQVIHEAVLRDTESLLAIRGSSWMTHHAQTGTEGKYL